jgi:carboxyl-terminal processing protease
MRGPKGTEVMITIIRQGESNPLDFTLVRDVIPIHSVKATRLQPGYGYVWVTHFRENTYDDLVAALEKLESQSPSMKGLVLDLRDNPGGVLDQAIRISDLFLSDGIIMTSKGRHKRHNRAYTASNTDESRTYPMVVLINGGSASASEIVAGALQDQKRALIIGTTSFGKGSVQAIENLRDGYALKYTIARYYTPSGRSIQAKGVEPDIVVAHKMIEAEPTDQNRLLKERDLANHLKAEPKRQKKEKTKKDNPKEPVKPQKTPSRLSPLDVDTLKSDSQIRRALDTLISYEIFNKLVHG